MDIFLQGFVNGISLGAIYTIVALSYTILFGTLRVANFAQGDIFMIGMFIGYTFYVNVTLPFYAALVISIIMTVAIMLIIQRMVYQPIYKVSSMFLFITTIGMATFLRNASLLVFGTESYAFPHLLGSTPWKITGAISIMPQNVIIIIACVILATGLTIFMRKTKTGLAMTAFSINSFAATLSGVSFKRMALTTYTISAAMTSIAGVLSAPIYTVGANVGALIGLKALIAAILGGFGNPAGAILGGMLLGLIEALGSFYISSAYKDTFAFIILIVILFIRPQGLFGRQRITKV